MRRSLRRLPAAAAILTLLFLFGAPAALAQEAPTTPPTEEPAVEAPADAGTVDTPLVDVPAPQEVPDVTISVDSDNGALSQTVTIIILLTIAAVAPGILLLTTAFTRFAIVLGLTRNAIGVQTIPPAQVLIGLSLILTFFVMGPVFGKINDTALQPMLNGEIQQSEAIEAGYEPLREFMLAQTRDDDLRLFMSLSDQEKPETAEDVSASTLIPAFVISELRTAFIIGFIIFIPFLVIDLIVSAVLMSMGMVMLPPVFISLPLKLLVFVLVDGWALIVGSVVQSVNGVV
ncbi:MAG: flagellar type III secretion system pore protein FliP [Acidimicrobiia bacterium]|nr:flagellar type III secretion system pore protein FliP [Acidimicrobiia bacterium]